MSMLHVPIRDQLIRLEYYNHWLKKNHPQLAIAQNEFEDLNRFLDRISADECIYYCHGPKKGLADPILTMALAVAYLNHILHDMRQPPLTLSGGCLVNRQFFTAARPEVYKKPGFIVCRFHPHDFSAGTIGQAYKHQFLHVVDDQLRGYDSWGMSFEYLQYLSISNHGYVRSLIAGERLNVALPGWRVAPKGDGVFTHMPTLDAHLKRLTLESVPLSDIGWSLGAGTFVR